MKKSYTTPNIFKWGKDTKNLRQIQIVYRSFYKQPKTMLMVSVETDILRANICRYVARLQKNNLIKPVKTGLCQITKHRAVYYTTNPELFPSIVKPSNTVKL